MTLIHDHTPRIAPWTFRLEEGGLTLSPPASGEGVVPHFMHGAIPILGPFIVIEIVFSQDHAFRFRPPKIIGRQGTVGEYVWWRPGPKPEDDPTGLTLYLPLHAEITLVQEYDKASRLNLGWNGTELKQRYVPQRPRSPIQLP